MIYLAAPVYYVDVTQAALCNKLGASATVANLPASFNMLGCFVPFVFACLVPHRWERRMAFVPRALMAGLMVPVASVLILPFDNHTRILAVIGECLILGLLNAVSQVYMLQCLARGTTEAGRARALKLTFTFGPVAAVVGSLGAQFILRGGIPGMLFPKNFALLHLIALPCAAITAWCCSRFDLVPIAEKPRPAFLSQLRNGFRDYAGSRSMVILWLAYLLWNCALYVTANLSLFTKEAMGRDPAEFSGLILAIRFGSKAVAGFGLGVLNIRYGFRAPLIATVSLIGLAMIWSLAAPGYSYLAAFGFLGAAELGGVYFPNAVLSWSSALTATRDLSLLGMTAPAASPTPALYGFVTDHWGFPVSFALSGAAASAALWLVLKLPDRRLDSPTSIHPDGDFRRKTPTTGLG